MIRTGFDKQTAGCNVGLMDACVRWYAQCSIGSQSGIDLLQEPWQRMAKEGRMPKPGDTAQYKVYSLRSDRLGAAMSLVFTHDDETFISVKLCIEKEKENPQCFPVSTVLDKGVAWKLKLHGELTSSGQAIMQRIFSVWKSFGNYNYLTNNCQDFTKATLKAFNLPDVPLDDRTFLMNVGGTLTVVGGIIIGLVSLFGKK